MWKMKFQISNQNLKLNFLTKLPKLTKMFNWKSVIEAIKNIAIFKLLI